MEIQTDSRGYSPVRRCFVPGVDSVADTAATHGQRKTKKPPQLPDLPSGPTGRPVPAIPLDSMAPVAPQVSYQNSQLTIVAPNSTLADILRAVKKQTGAEIDVPAAPERVVTHLGPGPAREVLAELLNGSRFNYVLLGSSVDNAALARVVLVVKTGPDSVSPPSGPSLAEQQQLESCRRETPYRRRKSRLPKRTKRTRQKRTRTRMQIRRQQKQNSSSHPIPINQA